MLTIRTEVSTVASGPIKVEILFLTGTCFNVYDGCRWYMLTKVCVCWPHGGKVKAPGDRPFAVASYCDRLPKNECEKDRQKSETSFHTD